MKRLGLRFRTIWLILWLAGIGGLSGCSVDPVRLDYDQTANFPVEATWAFSTSDARAGSPRSLMDQRVYVALAAVLRHRGWQEKPAADAAYLWRWDVVADTELVPRGGFHWGIGLGVGHRHSGVGLILRDPEPLKEKTRYRLVLEVIDTSTGRVIWHAESREQLLEEGSPSERRAQIERLVATLLQKWPPPGR